MLGAAWEPGSFLLTPCLPHQRLWQKLCWFFCLLPVPVSFSNNTLHWPVSLMCLIIFLHLLLVLDSCWVSDSLFQLPQEMTFPYSSSSLRLSEFLISCLKTPTHCCHGGGWSLKTGIVATSFETLRSTLVALQQPDGWGLLLWGAAAVQHSQQILYILLLRELSPWSVSAFPQSWWRRLSEEGGFAHTANPNSEVLLGSLPSSRMRCEHLGSCVLETGAERICRH